MGQPRRGRRPAGASGSARGVGGSARGVGGGAPDAGGGQRRGGGGGAPVSGRRGIGGEQVEGVQAVRELLVARRRRVISVTISDPSGRSEPLAEIAQIAASASYQPDRPPEHSGAPRHVEVRYVEREVLERLAVSDAPQGVVAFAEAIESTELSSLTTRGVGGPTPFLVVLDGITDPHNLGAVMRSALGSGVTGLVIPKHRSARLSPAALKAAAGAAEHLPIVEVAGVPAALRQLDQDGVWTVGLDSSATTVIWELAVADQPLALVLGAEGGGLSPLTARRCRTMAGIPLQGPLGSLNVSVAAAVACFEVARRRAMADPG